MAAVGKGCFLAGRILVAVVDMAQPVDTADTADTQAAGTRPNCPGRWDNPVPDSPDRSGSPPPMATQAKPMARPKSAGREIAHRPQAATARCRYPLRKSRRELSW